MPAPGSLGGRVVLHLLSRAGYGPRPGEIDRVLQQGPTRWLEDQLAPQADTELDSRLSGYSTLGLSTSRILAITSADPRAAQVVLDELANAK